MPSIQSLTIGNVTHQMTRSMEAQPHEIYAHSKADGSAETQNLRPVGRLTHKLIVQHSLGLGMSNRVRERSEAAVQEKEERKIKLDYDSSSSSSDLPCLSTRCRPRAHSGFLASRIKASSGRSSKPSSSRKSSPLPQHASSSSQTGGQRDRNSNLLVASGSYRKVERSPNQLPSASHLNQSYTADADVEDIIPGADADFVLQAAASSSSSSNGETSSLAFSYSPGTSVSSVDSPPSKEACVESKAGTGLGISGNKTGSQTTMVVAESRPNGRTDCWPPTSTAESPKGKYIDAQTVRPTTSTDSPIAANTSAIPPKGGLAQKRKREADSSNEGCSWLADEQSTAKRSALKANARTSGGSRLIRPISSAKSSPKRSIPSSHSSSPEPTASKASGRSGISITTKGQSKKGQGDNRWYTSSEGEDAPAEDAEGVSDTEMPDAFGSLAGHTPTSGDAMLAEYRSARNNFATQHSAYATSRQELIEQRRLFEVLIEGGTLSAEERLNVRSKNEIGIMVQRLQDARQDLLVLRKRICAYADS